MKYLDRIRNSHSREDSTEKSEQPYDSEPPEPLKVPYRGFRGSPHKGTQLFFEPPCTEPEPRATTLCIPTSQPTPDTSDNIPYRLNVGNVTRLVWLSSGLSPAEVLRQARMRYPDLVVTDQPPAHGWPTLTDIPAIPDAGAQQPVEAWTPSGKRLVVTAQTPVHADAIRRMNPPQGDSDGDREGYEERAAIMEYDGGLPRAQAEREAATCYYCKHWCGTRSGAGWCVLTRPIVQRQAGATCERFQAGEGRP